MQRKRTGEYSPICRFIRIYFHKEPIMKIRIVVLIVLVLSLSACSSTKKLESTAPFSLGEAYAQEWTIEEVEKSGHEVVIPILSLENEKAILKNLYYNGKMAPVNIELTEMGNVAVAEFGNQDAAEVSTGGDSELFPFDLSETQAVISYVSNEKVRYYKINGIRRNLAVSYPTLTAKNER